MLTIVTTGLLLTAASASLADDGHKLDAYIGGDVAAMQRDFGEPTLKTPTRWWYSNQQRVSGGMPGAPNPAIVGGRLGVMVSGAGGDYQSLTISPDMCDLTVTIDKDASVTSVETAGPGCFEYLHALKRARKPDS
ncbi:MAG: hypothetical protein ACU85U_11090 [Gammaproteobacteria bacterium]|jgi:hypothetical protein